jgi:hypothetical protein
MRITPDYKGRDDEYDDDTVRYYEEVRENNYFYELYVMIDGIKSKIVVTKHGVIINSIDGSSIHTNIVPESLFKANSLTWPNLLKIICIIEDIGAEGKRLSSKEMRNNYSNWKKENEQ